MGDKGRKQPPAPTGIYTFDPMMRDPVFQPNPVAALRGEHGWLTRPALQKGYRERWEMGMWDIYLYEHPGRARVWCVLAHRDGVEQSTVGRWSEVVDHDHQTLTEARSCFASWARHAAINIAETVLELT